MADKSSSVDAAGSEVARPESEDEINELEVRLGARRAHASDAEASSSDESDGEVGTEGENTDGEEDAVEGDDRGSEYGTSEDDGTGSDAERSELEQRETDGSRGRVKRRPLEPYEVPTFGEYYEHDNRFEGREGNNRLRNDRRPDANVKWGHDKYEELLRRSGPASSQGPGRGRGRFGGPPGRSLGRHGGRYGPDGPSNDSTSHGPPPGFGGLSGPNPLAVSGSKGAGAREKDNGFHRGGKAEGHNHPAMGKPRLPGEVRRVPPERNERAPVSQEDKKIWVPVKRTDGTIIAVATSARAAAEKAHPMPAPEAPPPKPISNLKVTAASYEPKGPQAVALTSAAGSKLKADAASYTPQQHAAHQQHPAAVQSSHRAQPPPPPPPPTNEYANYSGPQEAPNAYAMSGPPPAGESHPSQIPNPYMLNPSLAYPGMPSYPLPSPLPPGSYSPYGAPPALPNLMGPTELATAMWLNALQAVTGQQGQVLPFPMLQQPMGALPDSNPPVPVSSLGMQEAGTMAGGHQGPPPEDSEAAPPPQYNSGSKDTTSAPTVEGGSSSQGDTLAAAPQKKAGGRRYSAMAGNIAARA